MEHLGVRTINNETHALFVSSGDSKGYTAFLFRSSDMAFPRYSAQGETKSVAIDKVLRKAGAVV